MTRLFVVFMLVAVASLVGCGSSSKLTLANYDKIKDGMTEAEVEAVIGKGQEQGSSSVDIPGQSVSIPGVGTSTVAGISMSAKAMMWQEGTKIITITYSNGKVMAKAQNGL